MKSLSQLPGPYQGGCLITTITYKTPYFKKISAFKKFRDKTLLKRTGILGKFSTKSYYMISRSMVPFIYNKNSIKKILLKLLIVPSFYFIKKLV
jgi:hypothetical protein